MQLSLDEPPVVTNENESLKVKKPFKPNQIASDFNLPLSNPETKTRIIETIEETARDSQRKTSKVMQTATRETIGALKSLELSSKVGSSFKISKNMLKKGVNSVSGVISAGIEQSSAILASQVAIIKDGLDDAMNLVKDNSIKKRITDIVSPILRKVFIHSIACELRSKYDVSEIIGKGSFSVVRKAIDVQSRMERAVKIIIKNNLDENQTKKIQTEVETLKALDHPNIIRVTEVVEEVSKLCIVTELCTGGELFDRIIHLKTFDEKSAARIMYQLLSGLIHIHKKGFIHMDLKPENIMFADNSSDTVKIIDLGIAQSSGQFRQNLFGSVNFI
jgi:tRNA A-37 threonylcarbamoyl transferase component Bud32